MMTKRTLVFDSSHLHSLQVDSALRLHQLLRVHTTPDLSDNSEPTSLMQKPGNGREHAAGRERSFLSGRTAPFGRPFHRSFQFPMEWELLPLTSRSLCPGSSPVPLALGLATSMILLLLAQHPFLNSRSSTSQSFSTLKNLLNGIVLPLSLPSPPN